MMGAMCLIVVLVVIPMMLFFEGSARLEGMRRLKGLEGDEE